VLGIGSATKIEQLTIEWPKPSTRVDKFTNLDVNRYVRIREGGEISDMPNGKG